MSNIYNTITQTEWVRKCSVFLCRASHCFHLHSLHRLTPDPGRSVSHHSPNTTHIILNCMAHKHGVKTTTSFCSLCQSSVWRSVCTSHICITNMNFKFFLTQFYDSPVLHEVGLPSLHMGQSLWLKYQYFKLINNLL